MPHLVVIGGGHAGIEAAHVAARLGVPTTLLMGSLEEPTFRRLVAGWGPHGDEFAAIADAEVVKLGTAHWPQFSAPDRLGVAIVDAITR